MYLGADLNRGVMRDIEERDDFSDSDEEMTDVAHMNNQVGQADSFKLITNNNKDFNHPSFSNSLNKILSESSQGNGSEIANHLIGGGLLSGANSGKGFPDMLTPNGAMNGIAESPIFADASFGNTLGSKLKKPNFALQMSLRSQESEDIKLLGSIERHGG